MLQSRQADEVFGILLGGITEGYGFTGTLIGMVSADGYLVFQEEADPVSGNPLRIPLWHPGSLLARTFWSGNLLHASPKELPHLPEEESILGSSPVLCLPVMRNLKVPCVEAKNCADRTCPNYYSENLKCWLRQIPPEFFTGGGNPEIHREAITACLRCEVFPPSALLVVRSVENGKVVTRENAVPISNLASEAGLALEVVSLYDSMKIMAVTDGLTGLFNHREFYQSLRRELERARRYRHTLSLLMIDVDDFKQFNDRFGHPTGDFALRKIGELLRKCARTTDIIARYGGEEFAVILPESTPGGALMVAERIKLEVAEHNFIQNASDPVHLTVSIGIYSSEGGEVSEDQMVSLADEASYVAKKSGKNRVVVKAPG
jgi:diguanylate cyclase (GGDEF)-like protein